MSVHGGDVFFDIKANKKPFDKGMAEVEQTATKASSRIGKVMSIGIATAAAAAVAGIVKVTKQAVDAGDEIDKMSQKMGMSARAYQEWDYVMQRCGTSMSALKASMKTLSKAAMTSNSAFQRLGISQEEVASLSQEQLFARVIQGLQGVKDTTERTYLAGQLLGRGATELGAVLNLTAQETDALRARARELGVMSDSAVKNCAAFKDAVLNLRLAFRGLGAVLAEYVLPIINTVINRALIPAITTLVKGLNALFSALDKFLSRFAWYRKFKKQFATDSTATDKSFYDTADAVDDVGDSFEVTTDTVKDTKKEVKALKRELLGFDKITKLSGENKTSSDSGLTGDNTTTATANTAAGAVNNLASAYYNLGEAENAANKNGNDGLTLWEWFKQKYPATAKVLETVGGAIKKAGTWVIKGMADNLEAFMRIEGVVAKATMQVVEDACNGILKIKNYVQKNFPKVVSFVQGKWKALKKKIGTLQTEIKAKFDNSAFGRAWNEFKRKHPKLFKGLQIAIKFAFPSLTFLTKWIASVKARLATALTLPITLGNAISGKKEQKQGDTLNDKLGRLMGRLGIPWAAEGTVVKRNTPQLAVIGDNRREGEIVAPDSKLQAMANAAAGNGNAEMISLLKAILTAVQNQNTDVYLDGEKIKNNVVKRLNAHTRATGQPELIY